MAQFGEFVVNHWLLVLALVVILVLIIAGEAQRKVLGFADIKPQEAVRLMNQEDAIALDVRDDQEYKQGHVINAVHIPLGLLDKRLGELEPHKDKPIVVYCRTGQRSAQAGVQLRKQGYTRIYKLGGGMLAWQGADLPVTTKK
ncbi:MAG: rhodanese-like domain-containing protein [Pseudomonadota bacterium]